MSRLETFCTAGPRMAVDSNINKVWKMHITSGGFKGGGGNILRESRLRWLGHVLRMDHQRVPQQALYWQVPGYKRGPGQPANWRSTVNKDLQKMGFTCTACRRKQK